MIKIAIIDDDKGFLIKYKSMTEEFMNGTDMGIILLIHMTVQRQSLRAQWIMNCTALM